MYMLGLDFGTSNSTATVFRGDVFEAVRNPLGGEVFPSRVQLLGGEWRCCSAVDVRQPHLYGLKRLIGLDFVRAAEDLPEEMAGWLVAQEGVPLVLHGGQHHTLFDLICRLLSYILEAADVQVGGRCEELVVTTPAYFADAQRQFLQGCLESLGRRVLGILNEPTAALLALGLGRQTPVSGELMMVYDFGAGTLDVSVVEAMQGVYQVLSISCDPFLGGEDYTELLRRDLLRIGVEVSREEAEAAKVQLCTTRESFRGYTFEDFYAAARRELLFASTFPIQEASAGAGRRPDCLVLIGGCSQVPFVRAEAVRKAGARVVYDPPAELGMTLVSRGACVHGLVRTGAQGAFEEIMLVDILPLSIGVEMFDGSMEELVARGAPLPATHSRRFALHPVARDGERCTVRFFQGNRLFCRDNHFITEVELHGAETEGNVVIHVSIDSSNLLSIDIQYPGSGGPKRLKKCVAQGRRDRGSGASKRSAEAERLDREVLSCMHSFNRLVDNLLAVAAKVQNTDSAELAARFSADMEAILEFLFAALPASALFAFQHRQNYLVHMAPVGEPCTAHFAECIDNVEKIKKLLKFIDSAYGALVAPQCDEFDGFAMQSHPDAQEFLTPQGSPLRRAQSPAERA